MTDEEFCAALWPTGSPEAHALLLKSLTPGKRRAFEAMFDVANRLNAGESVPGVIVCSPHA